MYPCKTNNAGPAKDAAKMALAPALAARKPRETADGGPQRDTEPIPLRTTADGHPKSAIRTANADQWPAAPGYEIIAKLGHGSMGVVYKARNLSLNRLVALKMMRCPAAAAEETLRRFVDEARLIASLQHPNIILVHEIRIGPGIPFFAMELAEGGSLAERINGTPQPIRQAAEWTETLARAIGAAHQRGIVHRDLKPANIMLQESGIRDQGSGVRHRAAKDAGVGAEKGVAVLNPDPCLLIPDPCPLSPVLKITDFGLAKQLGNGEHTESGMILGTPSYMAPEQAEGKVAQVGPASDVYALGAILYEMLTGRPPYAGASPLETVLQLFQIEPVAPSRLQPKVPRDLETICLKCLHKEPGRRYAHGSALAQDLRRFLAGEPIAARPASMLERTWKWMRRRPALAALITGAIIAVFGLVGLLAWHQADLQDRPAEEDFAASLQAPLPDGRQEIIDPPLPPGEALGVRGATEITRVSPLTPGPSPGGREKEKDLPLALPRRSP